MGEERVRIYGSPGVSNNLLCVCIIINITVCHKTLPQLTNYS